MSINWQVSVDGRFRSADVDYGYVDAKGRKIGGAPEIAMPAVYDWGEGKTKWAVRLYTTRDGLKFGAIPRATFHDTEEKAKAYAEKACSQAQKRFAKKFGPAV
jgi:hypothetical protein